MKTLKFLLIVFTIILFYNCKENPNKPKSESSMEIIKPNDSSIIGIWKRMSSIGPMRIQFKENGKVESDLGDNNSIDVISNYKITNDTIQFFDESGNTCPELGVYKIYNRGYTISFDLIADECNGRIKSTLGFWVPKNHEKLILDLNSVIETSDNIDFVLHRARMNLALGKSKLAKKDFDVYLDKNSTDPKVFINRAGTRFPYDFKGVLFDCNKSIAIDSTDKNAYFLRGLAFYGLGEKQKGCEDFQKSINLGFTILKQAEYDKCNEYW